MDGSMRWAAALCTLACGPALRGEVALRPGADVEGQLARIRALRASSPGPLTVRVAPGVYALQTPIRLTAADAGLSFVADGEGEAVFSGGRALGPFRDTGRGWWEADAAGVDAIQQLTVNGRFARVATSPNEGYYYVKDAPEGAKDVFTAEAADACPARHVEGGPADGACADRRAEGGLAHRDDRRGANGELGGGDAPAPSTGDRRGGGDAPLPRMARVELRGRGGVPAFGAVRPGGSRGRREVGQLGDAGRGTGHDERVAPGNVEEALRLPVLRRVGRRADASARRDFGADEPFGRKGEEVAFDEGVDASVGAAEHKEDVVGVGRVDEGIDDGCVQAHALAVVATAVEVGCRDVGTVGMPGGLRQKKHRGDQRSEHDVRIISYSPVRGPPLLL